MELIKSKNFLETKKIINFKKYEKILVVGGENSYYLSNAKKLVENLLKNKNSKTFFKKNKLPEFIELTKLIKEIKGFKPNLIIAIGGGAVIDLAKVANSLVYQNNLRKSIIFNKYKIKNFCELLAIPMTAGTGAEVTTNAVIYINKIKYSVEGDPVKPKHMALFPELVITNKNKIIITSSAFDSFAQSIESMFSRKSNNQSLIYSEKSIKLFIKNYKNFIKSKSLDSGYKMALASYYSGKAISISKTIAPHAVSYPFTSYFNINHGHAVSLTFEEILEHNYNKLEYSVANYDIKKRYQGLFSLLGVKKIEEFKKKILGIKKDLSLEGKLSRINRKIPENLNLILKSINTQRLDNNPIKLDKNNIHKILKKIS